jgi:hypothetical protein
MSRVSQDLLPTYPCQIPTYQSPSSASIRLADKHGNMRK